MGCRGLGWYLLLWGAGGDLSVQGLPYCAEVLLLKGDKPNFVYVEKLSIPKCFRHLHNFIQGLLSCMPPISSSEKAFSFCLLIQPSQHGTQRTNNLNFSVTFEILLALGGSHGLVLEGVMGPTGGTCPSGAGAGNKAVCLRHLRHCQVPVFKKLNRAPLTTATRFPVI